MWPASSPHLQNYGKIRTKWWRHKAYLSSRKYWIWTRYSRNNSSKARNVGRQIKIRYMIYEKQAIITTLWSSYQRRRIMKVPTYWILKVNKYQLSERNYKEAWHPSLVIHHKNSDRAVNCSSTTTNCIRQVISIKLHIFQPLKPQVKMKTQKAWKSRWKVYRIAIKE